MTLIILVFGGILQNNLIEHEERNSIKSNKQNLNLRLCFPKLSFKYKKKGVSLHKITERDKVIDRFGSRKGTY